ncbi:putative periplasmic binding protein-like I [Rosa chinensis]|uniref:Glutamate receptor n=1 Tax=Rosa chinensis TaxID=74649 RepID=A0A2P6QTQ1_ROSCH|nr:glutamate receptor 2.9 [Rosa chinensis]PRQ37558.1 putative periplasmic binding protein-like I [Rosa chinensis]
MVPTYENAKTSTIPGSLTMANQKHFLWFIFIVMFIPGIEPSTTKEVIRVLVGVVLNLKSSVGAMAENCMTMALDDFYAKHAHIKQGFPFSPAIQRMMLFQQQLKHLINIERVSVIIGPQSSAEAKFVIELGRRNHVPIISFSATSPSLSPSNSSFFIRTAFSDSAQVEAIAAIVGAYSWLEVVLIYEDTEYGNSLIPFLVDAFQKVGARVPHRSVIPPHYNDREILKELNHLKSTRARIFLVHMTAFLGSKLFLLANKAGMMTEGYGWIVTEGLSTLLDPVGSRTMDSMQGVVGVRPYIPMSKELEDLVLRMKRSSKITGVNLFGLWAYDTVWALAMAVEKVGIASRVDPASLGTGQNLLEAILDLKFENLSGNFRLVKGQLEASTFEVFNVIGGKERIIGYWNQKKGLSRKLNGAADLDKRKTLEKPIWPGYTTDIPPTKKLKIGVPLKQGFNEFLKFENNHHIFFADIFFAAVKQLPFSLSYEFSNFLGTYDELLYQIYLQKYDAVVGDTTIVANRSIYVDFTLPYSESGVSMIVLTEDSESNSLWIFLKPLSLGLWLTTGIAFILTGFVIWVLEHRENTEFRGPPQQQLGMIFWFSFSTLVFAHREKVVNNWSRFVLIVWVFVVLILTQSYTASLASMLTVQKLQPAFTDIKEIQRNGYKVGYQNGSFIKGFLIEHLNFDVTKLVPLETISDYHNALSRGNKNGVAAILDEVPYLKLFLKAKCSKYTMVGPTYKTDGFGFAFPIRSPLVSYMSRAILNVTQDKNTYFDYFDNKPACEDQTAKISSEGPSLGVYSFGGLFIIAGVASMVALLMYMYHFLCSHWPALRTESTFWEKLVEVAKHFDKKDLTSHQFKRRESRVHASDTPDEGLAAPPGANDMQNNSAGTHITVENNLGHDENENLSSGHTDSSMPVLDSSS